MFWAAARAELKAWTWLGPAELVAAGGWHLPRGDGARHRPDLGLFVREQAVAVEVELHAKSPHRLKAILRAYRAKLEYGGLAGLTYVTDKPYVEQLVRRHMDREFLGKRASVGNLDVIIRNVRSTRKEPA